MSILLFNGFLLLGFVVATERLVLGSPGAMQAVEAPVKKCRYSRIRSMLQADCDSLELHDIPRHLQADIEVRVPRVRIICVRLSLLMSRRMPYERLAALLLRDPSMFDRFSEAGSPISAVRHRFPSTIERKPMKDRRRAARISQQS